MLTNLFQGLFDSGSASAISPVNFLLCVGASLIIGTFLAASYTYKTQYTQSFVITLALIPAVVCVVILMVNGNLGAGVAVAGAFSLVRFRSAPGTAREICAIFLAMGAGLIAGMGYLAYAFLFTFILTAASLLYTALDFGHRKKPSQNRTLHITIPENLDYTDVFTDLLTSYSEHAELLSVKTTNLGSLFKLTYQITLRKNINEKEFLDQLRCRNGNLEISLSSCTPSGYEL